MNDATKPPQKQFDLSTIGGRAAWARAKTGLSQNDIAIKAGVSQGTIGNLESGGRTRLRRINAIARALEVRIEWLEDGKGDPWEAAGPAAVEACAGLSPEALALATAYNDDPVMRGRIETALHMAGISHITEAPAELPGNVHKIDSAQTAGRRHTAPTPPASGPEQYKDPHQRLDDEVRKKRGRGRGKNEEGGGDGERH